MKRLTYFDGGKWRLKIGDTEYSGEAVDRLAAYEDTGLEPETISELRDVVLDISGDLDRLCTLAQADKEGKFPEYTIGDIIYDRFGMAWTVALNMSNVLMRKSGCIVADTLKQTIIEACIRMKF